jgi:EAL domain-containing protein (putative c-di-GMP-specific phosphodiesterase class I)
MDFTRSSRGEFDLEDMADDEEVHPGPCAGCRNGAGFSFDFSMAFQPIIEPRTGRVFAYEALVRGLGSGSAESVLRAVNATNRYSFDQRCRMRAIELASRLDVARENAGLSINFMPNAIYRPEVCIRTTLETARREGFPTENLIFEFTENQQIREPQRVLEIISAYRAMGFRTAIDDFGAGYAGLNLLAEFQPDLIKLDMALIRNVDQDPVRQAIVEGIVLVCDKLRITVIAEGIETEAEFRAMQGAGIELFQGYFFAQPAFEALPAVNWPDSV